MVPDGNSIVWAARDPDLIASCGMVPSLAVHRWPFVLLAGWFDRGEYRETKQPGWHKAYDNSGQ